MRRGGGGPEPVAISIVFPDRFVSAKVRAFVDYISERLRKIGLQYGLA